MNKCVATITNIAHSNIFFLQLCNRQTVMMIVADHRVMIGGILADIWVRRLSIGAGERVSHLN